MTKPLDIAAAIDLLLKKDPTRLKIIGREVGLEVLQKLVEEEANTTRKQLLEEVYEIELKIVEALKEGDEEKLVELELKGKETYEQIKLISALVQ